MTYTLLPWIAYHSVGVLFWLWVLKWGGAERIEGWRAWFLVGWFAGHWEAEQIRFYALLALVGECIWFLIGLFAPALRFSV